MILSPPSEVSEGGIFLHIVQNSFFLLKSKHNNKKYTYLCTYKF